MITLFKQNKTKKAHSHWHEKGGQSLMREARGDTKALGCGWGGMALRQHTDLQLRPVERGRMVEELP